MVGIKDRGTKEVRAQVTTMKHEGLRDFIAEHANGAKVYRDEAEACKEMIDHQAVKHGVGGMFASKLISTAWNRSSP